MTNFIRELENKKNIIELKNTCIDNNVYFNATEYTVKKELLTPCIVGAQCRPLQG